MFFIFVLEPKLVLAPVTPPPAHVGAVYFLQLQTQAGSANVSSWSISSGQLPPGLQFTPNPFVGNLASISGTATQAGSFSFTVQAKDFNNLQTATLNLTIAVDTQLGISKASLQNGSQNHAYSDSFTAVNATTPLTWTITSGALPPGLSLNPNTGQVSGTPTGSGVANFSVTVTDQHSPPQTDTKTGSISITSQLILGQNQNLTAIIGQQFFGGIFVTGGTLPYTYTIVSGQLPPGISLNNGNFFGAPTQLGDFPLTVQVQDSTNPPYVLTGPVDIKVNPVPLVSQAVFLTAPIGLPLHSAITVSGGTRPYTWAAPTGNFPPGLSLNTATGAIDGVPTQLGNFSFSVKVTDSGVVQQTISASGNFTIRASLGRNDSIATATRLGSGTFNASISPYTTPAGSVSPSPDSDYYKLIANAGDTVHAETFAQRLNSQALIDTVIEFLDGNGARLQNCGKPSFSSPCLNDDIDSTTTDSALDLQVPGAASTQTTFYLHVFDWRGDARPDMTYNLNISGVVNPPPPLVLQTTIPNSLDRTINFQQQLATTGGTGAVSWSLTSGTLPPGITLTSAGLLSGVPTTNGTYTFTIVGTDSGNPPQSIQIAGSIIVFDPLIITSPATFPDACVNQPYSFQVTATGGSGQLIFGFFSPNWPAVNLSNFTGLFSGTPDVTGTFSGQVSVQDSSGGHNSQTVSLTVKSCF